MLVVVAVTQIVLALFVERLAMQLGAFPAHVLFPVHAGITAIGLLMTGAIVLLLLRSDSVLFVDPVRPTPVPTAAEVSRHAADVARIRAAFESERVYRRMGLTVGALADHLKVPEYRLRALIHSELGFRNFNTLLHHYRVAEVSDALADPDQDDTPVLTLALSAGSGRSPSAPGPAQRPAPRPAPPRGRRKSRPRQRHRPTLPLPPRRVLELDEPGPGVRVAVFGGHPHERDVQVARGHDDRIPMNDPSCLQTSILALGHAGSIAALH